MSALPPITDILGHAFLLRRQHCGVGRWWRYEHCCEAIIFEVEFLISVSGGVDSLVALAHQELEPFDPAVTDLHLGAQAADGRG